MTASENTDITSHCRIFVKNCYLKTAVLKEKIVHMDVQASPECFVKFFDDTHSKNIPSLQEDSIADMHPQPFSYLISLQQPDGTSQIVQLTEDQAESLGIFVSDAPTNGTANSFETANIKPNIRPVKHLTKTIARRKRVVSMGKSTVVDVYGDTCSPDEGMELGKPLGSCENPIEIIKDGEVLHSTQNLSRDYLQQIAQALQFEAVKAEKEEKETPGDIAPNVIYRVVYPEELDLKPVPAKPIKRGRPKKKPCLEEKPDVKPTEEPRPVKSVRTRSGRITRPPQYIKKDFKKIDTSEVDGMETDLKTVEFEPLKTNQPPTPTDIPVKVNQLENHQRKRSIAAQFRCPKCKKAYLGHSKMLKHLQKHPDHGPIPEHCKSRHNDTWNYLIDLSNKNPVGQRGVKFCKELVTFLHNVRVLAKMFFKRPTGTDKNLYYVDGALSSVLGIEPGNYMLNESELNKEVNVFSFLNSKRLSENTAQNENLVNDAKPCLKTQNANFELDMFVQKCQSDNRDLVMTQTTNCNESLSFDQNGHCYILNGDSNNDFNHKLNPSGDGKNSKPDCSLDDINFDTIQNASHNGYSLNCDITAVKSFDSELQKFNEHINGFHEAAANESCKTKSPQLDASSSTQVHEQNSHIKPISSDLALHSDLLSENSLLNSLPNLRTSVEELMLNNVDAAQVSNLLDNSTSSDEVMNVDQFVNERFKNLTESDLELPNTSLNLDLPSLELFQFHTS